MPLTISSELTDQFAQNGVVLLPGALEDGALDQCMQAWQWSFDHPGPLASGLLPGSDHAWQDLCHPDALSHYATLVAESPLADYAKALWGSQFVWFLYEPVFRKSAGLAGRTPWHQDTSYLALGGDHLIAFWIPFEPLPAEASLEFVRGSHLGTLYNTTRFNPNDETLPITSSDTVPNLA